MLLCFVMLYYILLYYYVSCVTLCYFVMLSCVVLFYIMLLCYVSQLYYIIIVDLATVIFSPLRTPVLLSPIKTIIPVPKYPLTQSSLGANYELWPVDVRIVHSVAAPCLVSFCCPILRNGPVILPLQHDTRHLSWLPDRTSSQHTG